MCAMHSVVRSHTIASDAKKCLELHWHASHYVQNSSGTCILHVACTCTCVCTAYRLVHVHVCVLLTDWYMYVIRAYILHIHVCVLLTDWYMYMSYALTNSTTPRGAELCVHL